jgi:hypothetical protein
MSIITSPFTEVVKKTPVVICYHWLCSIDGKLLTPSNNQKYRFINVQDLEFMVFNGVVKNPKKEDKDLISSMITSLVTLYYELNYVPVILISSQYIEYIDAAAKAISLYENYDFDVVFITNTQHALTKRAQEIGGRDVEIASASQLNQIYWYKNMLRTKGHRVLEQTT